METTRHPLVSIGVPVFNGEAGIGACLDSLLAQDYPNIEVIISDNGSTDATPAICAARAAADSRVRYVRSVRNQGFVWNFNRVFELATGEYFMWAAHDDTRDAGFVGACVEQLERRPDAVLCQAHTAVRVEGSADLLYVTNMDSFAQALDPVARYHETLRRFPMTAIYGLYRSWAIRRTLRVRRIIASDVAFIQELSLHGAFIQVPTVLFHYSARSSWNSIDQEARLFLNRERKPWYYVPLAMLFLDHCDRLIRAPIAHSLKPRLFATLLAHHAREVLVKLALKAARVFCPAGRREAWGRAVYDSWLRNPNLVVTDPEAFFQRVCKPQLGWWR